MVLAILAGGCAYTQEEQAKPYRDDAFQQVQLGHYHDACESFQAALKLQPNDIGLIYNVGYCSERAGDLNTALQCYDQCVRAEPDNGTYRHALASVLLRQGRRSDAICVVQNWLAQHPSWAEPYTLDGCLWHEIGDLPAAQSRLQQALALDPHNVRAMVELGSVFEEMNAPDRAMSLYNQALDLQPNQPDLVVRVNALQARLQPAPPPQPAPLPAPPPVELMPPNAS
jgi:tetratricopeptide (TPR) repeat protein